MATCTRPWARSHLITSHQRGSVGEFGRRFPGGFEIEMLHRVQPPVRQRPPQEFARIGWGDPPGGIGVNSMNKPAAAVESYQDIARMEAEELARLTGLSPPRRRLPGGPAVILGVVVAGTVTIGAPPAAIFIGAGAVVIGTALMVAAYSDLNSYRRRCWAALVEERADQAAGRD